MDDNHFKIKTVQDMIDCTNEANLDNFLTDLKALLTAAHSFRAIAEIVGEKKKLPKKLQEIKTNGFVWIDDGKCNITITIAANLHKEHQEERNLTICDKCGEYRHFTGACMNPACSDYIDKSILTT
jgi:hypothetical protein